jgi:nucleolin
MLAPNRVGSRMTRKVSEAAVTGNFFLVSKDTLAEPVFTLVFREEVKIITFRNRSKGYGFVRLSTDAEADKAVAELKGVEFDGRAMNVEKATPQVPRAERPARSPTATSGARGARRGARGRGGPSGSAMSSARRPARQHDGPASSTTIFVSNLPYSVIDEDLMNIFAAYNVVKAHVVRRANNQSKGFGFVTVATEADQKRALEELKEVECDDRPLNIRAAFSEEPYADREGKKEQSETA